MIILCSGRRELGKTTLSWHLASKPQFTKQIAIDPRGMFAADDDPLYGIDSAEFFTRVYDPATRVIVIQPQDNLQGTVDAYAGMCREYIIAATPSCAIVIDEVGLIDLDAWDWVFRCAPRQDVWVILTAHRPQDFPTKVRALADYWCVFRTTQAHDLDAIEDRCGTAFAGNVTQLSPREFMMWDDVHGQASVYRDPTAWYTPLKTRSTTGDGSRPALVDGTETVEMPKPRGLFDV